MWSTLYFWQPYMNKYAVMGDSTQETEIFQDIQFEYSCWMYSARRRGEYSAVLDCNVNMCVVDNIKSNASGSDRSQNGKACLLRYLGHWRQTAGVKWSNAP